MGTLISGRYFEWDDEKARTFVICTDRSTEEQEKIRLISAREATLNEKEDYQRNVEERIS